MILNFEIKIARLHRFYTNMGVYRCILHVYKQVVANLRESKKKIENSKPFFNH